MTVGIITFVIGFFMTFFGRRMLKLLIFTMCALYGGLMAWMSLPGLISQFLDIESKTMDMVQMGGAVTASLVCGLLGHFFWKAAVFASGGLAGFMSGAWVYTVLPSGTVEAILDRQGYLLIFVLVGGLVSLLLEAYVVIGTSIVFGSFTMIYGMDKFLQLGFAAHVQHMIDTETLSLDRMSHGAWGMVAAGVVLAFVGLLAQCHQYRNKK